MKNESPSQNDLILDYLKKHKKGITPYEALNIFGCFRLSARISDLREKGYEIISHSVVKKNRYGHTCRFARYELKGDK